MLVQYFVPEFPVGRAFDSYADFHEIAPMANTPRGDNEESQ